MSFTDYIEDDELLEWYAYNYDTDYLDEMISWLNKLGKISRIKAIYWLYATF